MPTPSPSAEASRIRQSWVQLGALIVLVLLVTSLVSLFALWSQERAHAHYDRDLLSTIHVIDRARHAEVHFKTQVQEWKNVLLRGRDKKDRETHWKGFEAENAATDEELAVLLPWARAHAQTEFANRVDAAIVAHKALAQLYRNALATASSAFDPAAIDAQVRGIDRGLDAEMSGLIDDAVAINRDEIAALRATEAARYDTVRRLVWICNGIALVLVLVLLARILRHQARA